MKIIGFCRRLKESIPVEIEISFVPGLPQIHLIGQAHPILKESLIKIKSIIKGLGIELPKSKQIIVNLRAGDFQKKSLELELPIIVAILRELKAIVFPGDSDVFVHGELSLDGHIFSTELLLLKKIVSENDLITGIHSDGPLTQRHIVFENIKDLVSFYGAAGKEKASKSKLKSKAVAFEISQNIKHLSPPLNVFSKREMAPQFEKDPSQIFFTASERELLKIVSLGRHSLLLMGPRGLGKSTLAESLNFLAEPPDEDTFLHQMKYFFVEDGRYWRPFVHPHHSISHLALIGGGAQCLPGEITRAHGGILLMDEFLEFDPKCQEALREPMQTKTIHLARGQKYQKYDCDFQLIATTNLCICGQWLPGKSMDCSYSQWKCGKYRDKLSGPVIDRFHILSFMRPQDKAAKAFTLESISGEVNAARSGFKQRRQALAFNKKNLSIGLRARLDNELSSMRRLNASIEVAKTLCILRNEVELTDLLLNEALDYTWKPFLDLKS